MKINTTIFLFFFSIGQLSSSKTSEFPGIRKCLDKTGYALAKEAPMTTKEKTTRRLIFASALFLSTAVNFATLSCTPKCYKENYIGPLNASIVGATAGIATVGVISSFVSPLLEQKINISEKKIANYFKSEDSFFGLLKSLAAHIKTKKNTYFVEETEEFIQLINDTKDDEKRFEMFSQRSSYFGETGQVERAYKMFDIFKSYEEELLELKKRFCTLSSANTHYQDTEKLHQEITADSSKIKFIYDYYLK